VELNFNHISYYREQLERWVAEIDVKAKTVFDIGGADKPADKRCKSFNVQDYKILDLPAFDLNKDKPFEVGFADVIFCFEVFEYIYNPVQAMQHLADLLEAGGELYISFPFVYPIHNPVEMDYLRYTKHGVMKLLNMHGFEIEEMESRIATEGNGCLQDFYRLEGMRKAKQYEGHNEIGYLVKAIKK
jgi:SAM-dependent methyltransferase